MQWQVARLSIPGALGRGVRLGLPLAAIIAATVPVWGMSWYFDTENWAAGIWNSWAETRTDDWREAMVRAVRATEAEPSRTTPASRCRRRRVSATPHRSRFIVIGDTGEGDASQHVLRDQLLAVAAREDVRFVVIASDVVYPTGAMRDYENKFWLPFKGVTKPVLRDSGQPRLVRRARGFIATFLMPRAARAAMQRASECRPEHQHDDGDRIDQLVGTAARLRKQYGVPTGFQRAPFFDLQTERFALIAVDTGIVKRVDADQLRWLARRWRGPRQADCGGPRAPVLRRRLRSAQRRRGVRAALQSRCARAHVPIVMAGDTHDLEYYAEPPEGRPCACITSSTAAAART